MLVKVTVLHIYYVESYLYIIQKPGFKQQFIVAWQKGSDTIQQLPGSTGYEIISEPR